MTRLALARLALAALALLLAAMIAVIAYTAFSPRPVPPDDETQQRRALITALIVELPPVVEVVAETWAAIERVATEIEMWRRWNDDVDAAEGP